MVVSKSFGRGGSGGGGGPASSSTAGEDRLGLLGIGGAGLVLTGGALRMREPAAASDEGEMGGIGGLETGRSDESIVAEMLDSDDLRGTRGKGLFGLGA